MSKSFDIERPFDLRDRLALVTGGGSGLGRQFATVLSAAGAGIVLCGRRLEPLQETAAIVEAQGGSALCVTMDVADESSVDQSYGQICKQVGAPDILINNAGVNRPKFATQMTMEDWDTVIDINLRGCFMLARRVAGRLIEEKRGGSIVNVASVIGLRTQKATSAYIAAKAGLIHLTRGLALEWANYGIRVNALAPGYFRTDITAEFLDTPLGQKIVANTPMKRGGNLDELSVPLLLLAGDAGSFMTGSVLVVDGGLTVSSL
jgi:NAD(P)-dependent dehydrogenase (short-subunit alcohol dehydrogenase family)